MAVTGQINVRSGLHSGDLFATGAQAQTSTSSFATVTGADMDASAWRSVCYTITVATHDIDWQILGANASDYSDAAVVQASAKVTLGSNSSYSVAQAPFRFYRVQIKDDVAASHGDTVVNGLMKP